jgi:hypothetical protein
MSLSVLLSLPLPPLQSISMNTVVKLNMNLDPNVRLLSESPTAHSSLTTVVSPLHIDT